MIHVSVFHIYIYIYLMDPRVFSFHLLLAQFIGWLWVFLSVSIEAWLVHPIQAFKRYQWRWVENTPRLSSQKTTRSAADLESTIPPIGPWKALGHQKGELEELNLTKKHPRSWKVTTPVMGFLMGVLHQSRESCDRDHSFWMWTVEHYGSLYGTKWDVIRLADFLEECNLLSQTKTIFKRPWF